MNKMNYMIRAMLPLKQRRLEWKVGYYFNHPNHSMEHWMISIKGDTTPIKPETICRCSPFSLRDDFMGDMHVLFEGDIVEYSPRDGGGIGYGIVRFGEFSAGGYGIEGDGCAEGIGWFIEHTEPTIKYFKMAEYGEAHYLMYDEGELNKKYIYTGYDAYHDPEYLTKEVAVDDTETADDKNNGR